MSDVLDAKTFSALEIRTTPNRRVIFKSVKTTRIIYIGPGLGQDCELK